MAKNVEVKARIESVEALSLAAAAIADQGPIRIDQDDTFFCCDAGRLKLRMFSREAGELIFYQRPDERGPKTSFFLRSSTSEPETLRESLSLAYGQAGRVKKRRILFLSGRTRIHLDVVEGLGHFLELEVVLDENDCVGAAVAEAYRIMQALGVDSSQLVEGAYVDLIAASAGEAGTAGEP